MRLRVRSKICLQLSVMPDLLPRHRSYVKAQRDGDKFYIGDHVGQVHTLATPMTDTTATIPAKYGILIFTQPRAAPMTGTAAKTPVIHLYASHVGR